MVLLKKEAGRQKNNSPPGHCLDFCRKSPGHFNSEDEYVVASASNDNVLPRARSAFVVLLYYHLLIL